MAFKNVVFISMVTLIMSASSAVAIRNIKTSGGDGEGGLVECGNALAELKSCSNEILVYFLNGKADIGADCCRAIATITRRCWPAMLTSLGFTAQQGNILRGYCDAEAATAGTTINNAPARAPVGAASPIIASLC